MNRIQYWFRARTRYNLHSPFLFALYDEVLLARLDRRQAHVLDGVGLRNRCYHALVYKMSDFYAMRREAVNADTTVLSGSGIVPRAMLVRRPHRSSDAERQWRTLCDDPGYNIAIDLFDAGILLYNPRLRPQRWLLR